MPDDLILTSDDGYSVRVPKHDVESREEAAAQLAERFFGGLSSEYPQALIWLAEESQAVHYRKHNTESLGDAGCLCEDESWWCPEGEGDGPLTPFYAFDRADFETFERMANAEAVADA